MRPIDADTMLKQLEPGISDEYDNSLSPVFDILKKWVESQPTIASPNEWISVNDRLPENCDDVLCWYEYFRYGDYNRMYRTYGIGHCIGGYWGGEVSEGTRCKVLYWQPLPEPPGYHGLGGRKCLTTNVL